MWVLAIEQTLLFLLIIGRGLLPKGDISRDQLSQLLFVYTGIASDITEIFVLFEEKYVLFNKILIYIILTAWSLSLVQYTLVLTVARSRKTRVVATGPQALHRTSASCSSCTERETWAILTTIVLQDAPFLCIRLYVMIYYRAMTYSILFFTFKNALVMALQFYRVCIVACGRSKEQDACNECDLVTVVEESCHSTTHLHM